MNFRTERVGGLIQEELGNLMQREIEFTNMLVTITNVEIANKMETAKIWISVIPQHKSAEALEILEEAAPELQHKLLKKINIKPMPRIRFEIDFGADNAARIDKILND